MRNEVLFGDGECMFNMSLGFRHDSPIASPYGYTVKLAGKSKPKDINEVIRLAKN